MLRALVSGRVGDGPCADVVGTEQGHQQQQRPHPGRSRAHTNSPRPGIREGHHGCPGAAFNMSGELKGKCTFRSEKAAWFN